MIITIDGPKCSGKTTICKTLAKILNEEFRRETIVVPPAEPIIIKRAYDALLSPYASNTKNSTSYIYLFVATFIDRYIHALNEHKSNNIIIVDEYIPSLYTNIRYHHPDMTYKQFLNLLPKELRLQNDTKYNLILDTSNSQCQSRLAYEIESRHILDNKIDLHKFNELFRRLFIDEPYGTTIFSSPNESVLQQAQHIIDHIQPTAHEWR